jgi:translocation and assembly module TamB
MLTFRGVVGDDGVYDASADAQGVELQDLLKGASIDTPLSGKVSGRVTLQGTLEKPRLVGEIASQHVFFGDEGIGALKGSLLGRGDGSVRVEIECRSPRVDMTLRGPVALRAGERSELHLGVKDSSLDPYLRVLYPSLPSAVTIVATGEADLSGPLRSLPDLHATAAVSELRVNLPDYPVKNRDPLRFRLDEGVVHAENLRLEGEGTDLSIAGSAGLVAQSPLSLGVGGAADLRVLSVVSRSLRGVGAARLAMNVRGTVESPRVDGTLELSGGGLRVRGFPTGLEALKGRVRFTDRGAQLEDVSGRFGGGDVEVTGQANFAAARLTSIDVQLNGRGVALRYPEGVRSQLDLDLRFFGDDQRQWLTGAIDVRRALWTRRYDIASELLSGRTLRPEAASTREGVRLDLTLHAPGTLEVDNNLATLKARAELNVTGSSEDPVVLGRAEVDRGRVYFQGNTYTIRRGTVDFVNPQRTDPEFNIEGETRIRSYRVTLSVNGTLERMYPTVTSDPPLSAVQIVNLMAGADETAVSSLTQSQSDQAKLAVAGAATLFTGALTEQVGIGRQAERLFGLNRFSIDPALVKGDVASPTARLTVGKRVTPDLSMLYSIDLKNGRDQLISVEYTLSDRFSVLFTSSELSGPGVDIRVRKSR